MNEALIAGLMLFVGLLSWSSVRELLVSIRWLDQITAQNASRPSAKLQLDVRQEAAPKPINCLDGKHERLRFQKSSAPAL
jgi:hypothetical protein